ncbi:proline--tRNA ligase [Blastococcus brunescens]|uniref:Proline--tRNA ligase n=1 Tax=Blastococcus brunescens TaxID=1564165 RepID=A0ABZ1AY28_9ACTN|nr:proline--tRNA ligase [Blastococcus sp. BMG 8361]WRL62553.1 proline--tRNA ligase [Blastococcus sp. BMG 8361]
MSTLFLRTLRDDPADAEVPSHRLLARGGYIRRAAPGGFTWLPLGFRVFRNVERIVREEMDAMGAQEVHFPALLPREPYEATNRWTEYGPNLFRLKDRRGNDFLLGPTHEEMFTLLVKDLYGSYKDLPLSLYQIQTKYRDEARPRAGLFRGREFTMKDSYSFDVDDAGLDRSYAAHRAAYIKIFDRLGLEYVIVSAMSGAMGGSKSEEFLHPTSIGEDTFVRSAGGYAANVEAVSTVVPDAIPLGGCPRRTSRTPRHPDHRDAGRRRAADVPRCRVHRRVDAEERRRHARAPRRQPGAAGHRLAGRPGGRRQAARGAGRPRRGRAVHRFRREPGAGQGYIGPQVLGADAESKIRYLVDPRVVPGSRWITGANEPGKHVFDLVAGRDFTWDGVIEAAEVLAGDPAPDGSGPLELARGVEMGHIFQLGRKYAEALDLKVLDENGKLVTVTMGSYGIGVSRAVAAIAESTHDELGLVWPREVAPADVHLVATGKDAAVFEAAEALAAELVAAGLTVLYDDRPKVSPGVKFKDAELLGMPTIVTVGRGLAEGVIEVRDRRTGEREEVPVADAGARVLAAVKG